MVTERGWRECVVCGGGGAVIKEMACGCNRRNVEISCENEVCRSKTDAPSQFWVLRDDPRLRQIY